MAARPTVSVIVIGDEVLKGQTKDTNSHFICQEFYKWGLRVNHISVISDNLDAIAAEVAKQSEHHTFVITSGGVGPTHDDVTYEGVAKAFREKLVLNKELQNCLSLSEKNTKEAYVPQSSKINKTSNVFIPIVSTKNVFMFPGIPSYLEIAIKDLKHVFCKCTVPFVTRNLYTNLSEFAIVNLLNMTVEEYKDRVQLGCYPYIGNNWYRVKLSLEADSESVMVEVEAFLRSHLPQNCIVGEHPPMSEQAMKMFHSICDGKMGNVNFIKCVKESLSILHECFNKYSVDSVCLSFNGGKDCTVLLHLVCLFLKKKYSKNVTLKVLYVTSQHPFSETEEFIQLCARRYNLEFLSYEQPINDALAKLQSEHPEIKAVLMGSRHTDSQCSSLQPFQATDAGWPQFMRVSPLANWSYHDIWTFLRTLNIPYCSLYDRGYTSLGCQHNTLPNGKLLTETKDGREYYLPAYLLKEPEEERNGRAALISCRMAVAMQKISLQDIVSLCTSLGSLVNSISDHRSLVMVIGNGGEVTFSKQASLILSEFRQNHPLQKLIVSTAHQYHSETGNDCKIFILLLKEIMNGVKDLLTKLDEVQVRRLLLKEATSLMHHLPVIFKEIKVSNAHISEPFMDTASFSKDLDGILLTFLESKFSLCIAKELSKLIGEFIHKSFSDWSRATDCLKYLESRFNVFCSKCVSPVSQSRVLKGFVLNHRLDSIEASTDELVHFVVVWNLPRRMDDATWIMKKGTLQPSHYGESFVRSLCSLKSRGISAIVTPDTACENIKSVCLQNRMLIISGVEKEDIENILFFSGMYPLTSFNNSLEAQNVRCLKSIQTVASYTHLETLSDFGTFRPNHILLSAQVDSVWKEYYAECQNCLKVVKQWINPEIYHFPVEKGYDCLQHSLMYPGDSSTVISDDSKPHVFGIALPLGLFEISLRKTLNNSKEKHSLFPHLFFILNSALLKVACENWEIPLRCFNGKRTFVKFMEEKKSSLTHPIEPLIIKEMQLCKILQLVQQLIRIDAILPSGC